MILRFASIFFRESIKKKIDKTSFLNPQRYKKIKFEGMTYEKPNW